MIAAAASLWGSELVVGGFRYNGKPPTVAVALAVEAALQHGGEETDTFLRETCAAPDVSGRPWLPLSLRSVLFSKSVREEERRRVILTAMLAGVPDEKLEQAAKQQAEAQAEARRSGWPDVLSRFMATYPGRDVLALPWPFFLAMSDEIRREHARMGVEWARAYAAIRSGGEAWDGLVNEAGYGPPPPTAAEIAEAREQSAMVRAQLEALEATGSMLNWRQFMAPQTGEA